MATRSAVRLPRSGLTICGGRWWFGAEDMFVPSFYSVFFDLAILGVALTARVMSTSFDMPITCTEDKRDRLERILLANVLVWVLITLVDIIVAISAVRTNMFEGNRHMPRLIYLRMLLTLVVIVISSMTTAWIFNTLKTACFDVSDDTRLLDRVSLTLVVCGWLHVFFALTFLWLSFSLGGNTSHRQWTKRLRCLCCCCYRDQDGERDILGSIAKIFTEFFNIEGIHVVPSDIFVGMALVEASQRRRKKAGEVFYQSEGNDRWRGGAYEPPAPTVVETKEIKVPTLPTALRVPIGDPNLGVQASRGEQPILMREDWLRIAEAKHFARYANGAYGWMLYTFDHMSCIWKCAVCDCGCGPDPTEAIESGCCNGCGCHWSHNAFLLTTGLRAEDVLFVQLKSEVGHPVYYVAVDREKRALVIAIRGTLSISDAITDMYAKVGQLDGHGYPGHWTHAGILANATALRRDILDRGIVARFLAAHPDYYIQLCGHSLGAGTSSLLTLIMKDDFPGVPRRCVAFAPPLLVAPVLAQSPAVRDMITTIIYDHDIIPQLGLRNLFQMKTNMVSLFGHAAPRKWQIFRAAFARQHSKMFLDGVTHDDLTRVHRESSLSPRAGGRLSDAAVTAVAQAIHVSVEPDGHTNTTTTTTMSAETKEHKTVLVESTVQSSSASALDRSNSFERDLVPMTHCGRIYHMVPRDRDEGFCGCCAQRLTCTIYPASPAVFQEIVIASSMFSDHLPRHYTMDEIDLPLDVDLSPSGASSPPSQIAGAPSFVSLQQGPNTSGGTTTSTVTVTVVSPSTASAAVAATAAGTNSSTSVPPPTAPLTATLSNGAAAPDYKTFENINV